MARKRLELELDPGGEANTKWLLLDYTCISSVLSRVNPFFLKFHSHWRHMSASTQALRLSEHP